MPIQFMQPVFVHQNGEGIQKTKVFASRPLGRNEIGPEVEPKVGNCKKRVTDPAEEGFIGGSFG